MTFLEEQLDMLMNNVQGSDVINNLKNYYTTHLSFEKNVSNLRRMFLEKQIRNEKYDEDIKYIESLISTEKDKVLFSKFCDMNLKDQFDILVRTKKLGFFESSDLSDAIQNINLLPENMKSFCLNKEENIRSKLQKKNGLMKKNMLTINIENANHILCEQINILRDGSKKKIDIILALLFVSGRRECEILNGKSIFEFIPNRPYHVYFTGVLKKRKDILEETDTVKATIPLLCSSELFLKSLSYMRQLQGNDILEMTNKQISSRYCSQINNAQKRIFPYLNKPHDLRALYVKFVHGLFIHNISVPLLIMTVLCHDVIEESLFYNSINIKEEINESYGNLYESEMSQFPKVM
tara:strand:- start:127 stop:1179 length:1053 start_codon:yes stop_codon:yes gene_type:complete